MKPIHKSTNAPDGGYEILCTYEPVNEQKSGVILRQDTKEFWDYRWRNVTCKECLSFKKITREK